MLKLFKNNRCPQSCNSPVVRQHWHSQPTNKPLKQIHTVAMERDESNNKNDFITNEHDTIYKTVNVSMKNLLSTVLSVLKHTSNISEN